MTLLIAYVLLKHAGWWDWGTLYPYITIVLWAGHVYFHDSRCQVNGAGLNSCFERIMTHLGC